MTGDWPAIPLAQWADTRDTLQLWTQIVGKVRMVNTPLINHWWNIPLYVTARGLTTSLVPYGERGFEIDFDFLDHQLRIEATDGGHASMALEPRSVADFYAELMGHLDELGLHTEIWTVPVEIPDNSTPFDEDHEHASYDAERVQRFWLALVEMDRVFHDFRARFVGKASPVHLFWGALDLAVTRFSGRSAPLHPGGAPNCGPFVMHEAYSHEVSSCGYWPGGDGEGLFYSYAYPEPDGFRGAADGVVWDDELAEYVLPYEQVRTATDPDATLLDFLQRTYEAAADTAGWDRAALERAR
jgi:hypothetical protein